MYYIMTILNAQDVAFLIVQRAIEKMPKRVMYLDGDLYEYLSKIQGFTSSNACVQR